MDMNQGPKTEKTEGRNWISLFVFCLITCFANSLFAGNDTLRTMKYFSRPVNATLTWQNEVRSRLFSLLKLDELLSGRGNIALNPKELSSLDKGAYLLKEVEINSTFARRIRVLVTFPKQAGGQYPAVICIHGHGGVIQSVYDTASIYKGFGEALAIRNYVTIAAVVSQHKVYEDGMILMGERLWDLIRSIDYLESLVEVDKTRIGCAGLSLGGEMAMWLGAMDKRIKATVSAGFLTKMDHMEQNHCMCWKFPGLRQLVDYADIYSLVAPRALQCQNGIKEPLKEFYVPIAHEALKEIQIIYRDFDRPENLILDVHKGAHEIDLPSLLYFLNKHLTQ